MLVTNETLSRIAAETAKQNSILFDFAERHALTSWAKVHDIVARGDAPNVFSIGEALFTPYHASNGVTYDCPWIIVDFRDVTLEDGTVKPGMVLQMQYATVEDIPFDMPWAITATETTAQAGVYYCGKKGTTYAMLNLAAGASIPYGDYDVVYKGSINHIDVYRYGHNRYMTSGYRQWLNSDAGIGGWWESKEFGQVAPAKLNSIPGFKGMWDEDFLAVLAETEIKVAANTVTDGGVIDTMYDKFWLPSLEEMYGEPQAAGVEGKALAYWKEHTALENPSNAANNERKIFAINNQTSAQAVRLRSANRGSASSAWTVSATGQLYTHNATNSCRCAPACIIC